MYCAKRLLIIIYSFSLVYTVSLKAQNLKDLRTYSNETYHVASFLTIGPDSRGEGLGNTGAASSPDASSLYWNPAKYGFINSYGGFAISYLPYRIFNEYATKKNYYLLTAAKGVL